MFSAFAYFGRLGASILFGTGGPTPPFTPSLRFNDSRKPSVV